MAKKEPTIEYFTSPLGDTNLHFWRLRARNGEIVCTSEGYETKSGRKRGAERAVELMADAVLVDLS